MEPTAERQRLLAQAEDIEAGRRIIDGASPRYVNDEPLQAINDDQKLSIQRRHGIYTWLALVLVVVGVVYLAALWRDGPPNKAAHNKPLVFPGLPPPTDIPRNEAFLIEATHGAVAAEEATCSNMGVKMLKLGGTAVDAAITTTLCIGVINSFSSGIGGGGFMLVRVPNGTQSTVTAIDFRETSPTGSFKNMYTESEGGALAAQVGGLSVGVPGELKGLETGKYQLLRYDFGDNNPAHALYGNLSWSQIVEPAAEMAAGFRVGRELARRLRIFGAFMLEDPAWASVFAPNGALLVEGDWIRRTNLSRTLHQVAAEGAQAFYEGDIAEHLVKAVQNKGGRLTKEDLSSYTVRAYPALQGSYYGKRIYTTDAPSSGGVLLGLLQILQHYKIGRTPFSNLQVHRFVEALKMAFGARSEISDPAFASNVARHHEIYSQEWVKSRIDLITDNTTHPPDYYDLVYDTPQDHGTTHVVAVDRHGGVASVTSTVNLIFGSRVMDPVTGIILNDEQDDFSIPGAPNAMGLLPSPFNYPTPGKRPLSSTSPVIIEKADGSFHAALGGSGGSRIFGAVAQVMTHLERGLNVSAAVEAPRFHDQIFPRNVSLETGFNRSLIKDLQSKGHKVVEFDINLGIAEVQAIVSDSDGVLWAASDSRKNGVAAGY